MLVIYTEADQEGRQVETGATLVGLENIQGWIQDQFPTLTMIDDNVTSNDNTDHGNILQPPPQRDTAMIGARPIDTNNRYGNQIQCLFDDNTRFIRPSECTVEGTFDEYTVPSRSGLKDDNNVARLTTDQAGTSLLDIGSPLPGNTTVNTDGIDILELPREPYTLDI
jgi:hypothetical protein